MILIPFISSVLYLLGGQVNKWFRWLMGIPIAGIAFYHTHSIWMLLAIPAYFIATNAFSYGDKMIWTKLFGKWVSMGLSGFMLGMASYFTLGLHMAIVQALVGMIAFLVLKWFDDYGDVHNPWQELGRGFFGTCLFIFS